MSDIETARIQVELINSEIIAETIDAGIAQEEGEDVEIEDELHPNFAIQHPDYGPETAMQPTVRKPTYSTIKL